MHRIIGFDQSRRHRFRTRGKPEADLRAATCARGIFMPDSWFECIRIETGIPSSSSLPCNRPCLPQLLNWWNIRLRPQGIGSCTSRSRERWRLLDLGIAHR